MSFECYQTLVTWPGSLPGALPWALELGLQLSYIIPAKGTGHLLAFLIGKLDPGFACFF